MWNYGHTESDTKSASTQAGKEKQFSGRFPDKRFFLVVLVLSLLFIFICKALLLNFLHK
jgi:hypothetical protein